MTRHLLRSRHAMLLVAALVAAALAMATGCTQIGLLFNPPPQRTEGELPDMAGMIGKAQPVAEHMLGPHADAGEDTFSTSTGTGWDAKAQAYYSLEDLEQSFRMGMDDDGTVRFVVISIGQAEALDLVARQAMAADYVTALGLESATTLREQYVDPSEPTLFKWYGTGERDGTTLEWSVMAMAVNDQLMGVGIAIGLDILPDGVRPTALQESAASSPTRAASASDKTPDEPAHDSPPQDPPASTPELSSDLARAAADLGGTPQTGRSLYFAIIASEPTQNAARAKRDAAQAAYAEQMYFVVEPTDHLEGLKPGLWVVVEAHSEKPDVYDMDWYSRVAPDAYVKQAEVLCDDPIPVVDELVQ